MTMNRFCLLGALIICNTLCLGHTDYITHPASQNISLNLTVNFTCEATDVSLVFFYVGDTVAFENDIIIRGFYELNQQTINGTIQKRVLSVYAQEINNNSKISCGTIPDHITSKNATLIIQGLLAGVGDLKYTFINGSSVLLTWKPPYTLHNVPITGYYINDDIFTSNSSIVLSTTDPDPCILTNVTVSPVNNAGIGETKSIDFYYKKAPSISPDISVISLFNETRNVLINIDVAKLCKGEYPNDIKINILNTDDKIINSTSISPQVDNQLMIRGAVTVPNDLSSFIINIMMSNYGGNFDNISSIVFDIPGPVVNIYSYVDNCTTVIITWDNPEDHRNELPVLYYNLSIIDEVNNNLFGTVSVYGTSYQFEDEDIFIHCYTYVITGVNELGEGISENKTFSYARVPRSVAESAAFSILSYIQDNIIVEYNIPVNIECIGESPVNATVTVQCKGELHFMNVYLVEYTGQLNLSEMLSVPQYHQCSLSIVFSNSIGTSEPFVLPLYQQSCSQSENIGSISNLRACNDTPVVISVIFRATRNCSFINDDYHIIVFHHNLKMLKAVNYSSKVYDELFCLIHIELNDISVENNNTIWQVWIRHTAQPNNLYCSNNFTLIVNNDPPDPVTFMINVNCTDVCVDWSIPFSPPGCPVKYYEIKFNDVFVTTNMLSYSWSNVSYNTLYTVSISAVNDAGTGNKSTNNTFITPIVPEVSIVNYSVLLSSENAALITNNKVISDCPFSYPAHIQYNLTCIDNFVDEYAYNTVFNSSTVEFTLPLGLCNCIALITLDGDSQESFNFSTSLLIDVDLNVSTCEMLFITCSHSLPPFSHTDSSLFFGCAVKVLNSNDNSISKVISVKNNDGNWSMLYGGVYAISLFGCHNKDCSRNSSVCQEYEKMITISECGTSTATPAENKDSSLTLLVLSFLGIVIILIVLLIVLFIVMMMVVNCCQSS